MATVRVTLNSVGYPSVGNNCLVVLQKLCAEGYEIVLRDSYYKDKDSIVDFFDRICLPFKFSSIKDPDIDILGDYFRIKDASRAWVGRDWSDIDKALISSGVYTRSSESYVPSYKPDTYFLVYNYGYRDQLVDSRPFALAVSRQKATRSINDGKARTATIVDANTLRIVGVSDSTGFEEFRELVYFNNEL